MLKDLNELKLDYVLIDEIYANFYSKLINERFYVMRRSSRKRTFNVLLRGFGDEQTACFRVTSQVLAHQWLKSNITSNLDKVSSSQLWPILFIYHGYSIYANE
jgi:hypothetical protein